MTPNHAGFKLHLRAGRIPAARVTIVVALAAAAVATSGCSDEKKAKSPKTPSGPAAVAVARVVRQDLARKVELAAEFRPRQEVDLHAKVSGYLKTIYVDVGDRVRRGQPIAELEVPELTQELDQADSKARRAVLEVGRFRSEVRSAQASFDIAKISYDRLAQVMKARPNLIAQQELDDMSARFHEADATLMAAKASLAAAEEEVRSASFAKARVDTLLGYLQITAPFDGVITQRLADPGALIQAGTTSHIQAMPLVRVSEVDWLRLVLPVPDALASRIRVGQPVEVRVDSLNRVFQGHVSRSSGKLDTSTRTMETEVDIENSDFAIKPGMYGYVTLNVDRKIDALGVPIQAITSHTSPTTVLVVNAQNQVEQRQVQLGIETPDVIEIRSGVKENELVVLGSRSRLKVGAHVEPKLIDVAQLTLGVTR